MESPRRDVHPQRALRSRALALVLLEPLPHAAMVRAGSATVFAEAVGPIPALSGGTAWRMVASDWAVDAVAADVLIIARTTLVVGHGGRRYGRRDQCQEQHSHGDPLKAAEMH